MAQLASGIEAGIIGGLAMLLLLVSGSLLLGHSWLEVPNLLGSTFYGSRAFRQAAGLATLSGIALHFVITGTIGGAFGLVCGGIPQRRRLVLLGVAAGFVWYYFADAVFWSRVNPLVPLYSPQPVTLLAHGLFGACLGYMRQHMGQNHRALNPALDLNPVLLNPAFDREQSHGLPPPHPPPLPEGAAEPFSDALE